MLFSDNSRLRKNYFLNQRPAANYVINIHRRRKVQNIGGPKFRILGGGGVQGGGGGGQTPSRHMTSY